VRLARVAVLTPQVIDAIIPEEERTETVDTMQPEPDASNHLPPFTLYKKEYSP